MDKPMEHWQLGSWKEGKGLGDVFKKVTFWFHFFLYTNASIELKVSNRLKCSRFACEMYREPHCLDRSYDHSTAPGFSQWGFRISLLEF